jgi:hypothetical protein
MDIWEICTHIMLIFPVPCFNFVGTTFLGILCIYQRIYRRLFEWGEIYAFTLHSMKGKKA